MSESARQVTAHANQRQVPALAAAVITMLIWSSSFVFVKLALPTVGPLTISAIRYTLGALLLLPLLARRGGLADLRDLPGRMWWRLLAVGVSAYAIGNGAVFVALSYLNATTVSLLNSFIPVLVVIAGAIFLAEIPTSLQVVGMVISLAGSALFFAPGNLVLDPRGLALLALGQVGFSAFMIQGRALARDGEIGLLPLTAIPLLLGGGVLLPVAFAVEGWPAPSAAGWGYVLLLAVVHTALGYWLYNVALQKMAAFEMNVVLSLGPFSTALWAWLLLDEQLVPVQFVSMAIVVGGVLLVQRGRVSASTGPVSTD